MKKALFQMNETNPRVLMDSTLVSFTKKWHIVAKIVCSAVTNFFQLGKLLRKVNRTFVSLIPKTTNASHLSDFMPISCCNVLYKLITKVLSNRLLEVIGELVFINQNAFIKGRNISDCTLLAHEKLLSPFS